MQNGRRLSSENSVLTEAHDVHAILRLTGGKGGFGSMLRAIGAQIEKTTNREACRDLSGRRLRDINEEKRLKTWLDKQKEREDEAVERRNKKIERLLAEPKYEFKDEAYELARSELTQNVGDAVEEGFKKAEALASAATCSSEAATKKRKAVEDAKKKKRKRGALWIGDDLSSSSENSDSDQDSSSTSDTTKVIKTSAQNNTGETTTSKPTSSANEIVTIQTSDESSVEK